MTHKKACLAALVCLALGPFLTATTSRAANPKPATRPITAVAVPARPGIADITASARQVERLAEQLVTQKNLPGLALAIVQNGRIVSLRGYGLTGAPGGQAVGTDTVFRLASLSKGFAATLTGQLVSEGAMNWDTPIINQLPAFKLRDYASANKVTVRDVLSHRVGLTHNTYDRDLFSRPCHMLLLLGI